MTEQELRDRYIEQPAGVSPDRAYLRDSGVDVWALVMYCRYAADRDAVTVAHMFEISVGEVDAVLAFYALHKDVDVIDARITLNMADVA